MMPWKIYLIILVISSIMLTRHRVFSNHLETSSTMDSNIMNATKIDEYNGAGFENSSLCDRTEKKTTGAEVDNNQALSAISSIKIFDSRVVKPRSYYGYGGNTPAFYPAFDSLSILASLAFLAFLLQSFASLFDRSRSIIPAIVNGRRSSSQLEPSDPVKIVLGALEGYDILNDNTVLFNKERRRGNFSKRNFSRI